MDRASQVCRTLLIAVASLITATTVQANGDVNLYSYRQPFLIEPILEAFTAKTGIKVNIVFANKGMVEKIKAAGDNNPADAVLTVDVGRLDALAKADLLEPVKSQLLRDNIPAHLRHPDDLWFGLTTRARVVFAHKDRVPAGGITSLDDLADPRFRGRVCSRSGKHVYNIGLIAARIAHDGEAATQRWLRGVKANLAQKPQGNDRAQAKAIYEGICDVALANHYYMGAMKNNDKKPEQQAWADAIRVVFLDQQGRGQHVNISGIALVRNNRDNTNAIQLMEFLASDEAQSLYARINYEYPVKPGVATDSYIESFGSFKTDSLSLERIAEYRLAASQLVDRVEFDH